MTACEIRHSVMVFLNGKDRPSFRCHCGCNVFQPVDEHHYTCNSCGEMYRGDK